jgi:glycosyltransferase involved in cell wall biosynthesis
MVDHSKSTVVPNGIDAHYWKRHAEFRIPSDPHSRDNFRWLSVGRLDPVKDHATLLRAFAMLPPHASLAIAGSGTQESALRRLAHSLRIEDRVSFMGFQADVRRLMQESDAFVLASRWEGLPLALLEANACELPSVFTHTGGACELLPHASFPPVPIGSFAALAETMQALMNLPDPERRKLGLKARQHIAASFDLSSTLNRYEALYCHMLAVNPQPLRWHSPAGSPLQAPVCSSTPKT